MASQEAKEIADVLRYEVGRPMKLRRATGITATPWNDVTVYGTTDGAFISKLLGIVVESGSHVTFSNAEIAAASWPGPPKIEDRIVVDGTVKKLQSVETKYLGTEILVHVCKIIGI